MKTRRRSREIALQVLFQHDVGRLPVDEALAVARGSSTGAEWPQVEALCTGTARHIEEIDQTIERHLSDWTLDRLASADRVILRMALYEIRYLGTPPGVAISEAVELAKRYGTGSSGRFVNGVLGAIVREESRAG
ncbi:MAG: transcription antitermination factor NusB [Armatimonadetes bacterium]|nr:transcription antitermination factor NusB [Armatimonadota bacterium]